MRDLGSHICHSLTYSVIVYIYMFFTSLPFFLQSWEVFVDGQSIVIHFCLGVSSHRHQTKTIVNSPFCFPVSHIKVYTKHLSLDATLLDPVLQISNKTLISIHPKLISVAITRNRKEEQQMGR